MPKGKGYKSGTKPTTPRKSSTKSVTMRKGTKSKTIRKSSTQPSRFAPLGKKGINF